MRILVLGGSGFIGRSTIARLSGNEITVVHRGNSCSGERGVRHVHCDTEELLQQRSIFQKLKPDLVLDLLSRNGPTASRTTQALAGIAPRLVFASSISVYRTFGVFIGSEVGVVDNRPLDEEAPLRKVLFPYRRPDGWAHDDPKRWLQDYDKIPAEQAFLSQDDIGVSIVRLPMVYGPGDPDRRIGLYLESMLKGQDVVLEQTASEWRNARAYVENVSEALVRVMNVGDDGSVYNVSEEPDLTEAEWIRTIGGVIGWTGKVCLVPDGDRLGRPALTEFPVTANFAQHLRMDSSKIRLELGFRERVELPEALHKSIAS